jgi:hypothetical protein
MALIDGLGWIGEIVFQSEHCAIVTVRDSPHRSAFLFMCNDEKRQVIFDDDTAILRYWPSENDVHNSWHSIGPLMLAVNEMFSKRAPIYTVELVNAWRAYTTRRDHHIKSTKE